MHNNHEWPSLDYLEWKSTYETLHRWVQIVGKLRFCKTPWINHSWHSALYISSRGFTTTAIPDGDRNFTVEFDFIDHKLIFITSDGKEASFGLQNESVSAFYERFQKCLKKLKIEAHYYPCPNETLNDTPFAKDFVHCTYIPIRAHRCWQVMVRVNNVMNNFRSNFIGKSSPVHFFWGSFDLAVTRFSGRAAPEHPGGVPHIPDLVVKEAYSQEVSSCGFWPGNEMFPHAAFYSYAYPEPKGFVKALVEPFEAYYNDTLKEFILPYDVVVDSTDPEKMILSFFESTYRAAADLGNWDKSTLEESRFLKLLKEQNHNEELYFA
ncbi:MAG: hypothetical protein H7281_06185 [Bacteriovorax sp.]|nr:hypothetical protein [Bacteriovorax sp.]